MNKVYVIEVENIKTGFRSVSTEGYKDLSRAIGEVQMKPGVKSQTTMMYTDGMITYRIKEVSVL